MGLAKRLVIRLAYLFTLCRSFLPDLISNYLSESWSGTTCGSGVGKQGRVLDTEAGICLDNNEGHLRDSLGVLLVPWLLLGPLSDSPALTRADLSLLHRALSPWVLRMVPSPLLGIFY